MSAGCGCIEGHLQAGADLAELRGLRLDMDGVPRAGERESAAEPADATTDDDGVDIGNHI